MKPQSNQGTREITLPVDFQVRMCHWYIKALTPLSPISTNKFSRLISINILKINSILMMCHQWRIQGRGPGGPPPPPLFLDQTEGQKKFFWETRPPPPPLSKGLDDRVPSPPYLKVWIWHWPLLVLRSGQRVVTHHQYNKSCMLVPRI